MVCREHLSYKFWTARGDDYRYSIIHVFLECEHVTNLGISIELWLRNKLNQHINFGINNGEILVKTVILAAKEVKRKTGGPLSLLQGETLLFSHMKSEWYMSPYFLENRKELQMICESFFFLTYSHSYLHNDRMVIWSITYMTVC